MKIKVYKLIDDDVEITCIACVECYIPFKYGINAYVVPYSENANEIKSYLSKSIHIDSFDKYYGIEISTHSFKLVLLASLMMTIPIDLKILNNIISFLQVNIKTDKEMEDKRLIDIITESNELSIILDNFKNKKEVIKVINEFTEDVIIKSNSDIIRILKNIKSNLNKHL